MKKCLICLKARNLWETKCCGVEVHYICQVQFGNSCIICGNEIKCVSSTRYVYVPETPLFTPDEIEENMRAMREIERRRELDSIPSGLTTAIRNMLVGINDLNFDSSDSDQD
jgi:hypothetical protein